MKHLWSPWRMEYIQSNKTDEDCVFCRELSRPDPSESLIVHRGPLSFVILNRFPYTTGHVMVVPYDHQPSLELLNPQTRAEIMEMVALTIQVLQTAYQPQGFNVGVNIGAAAGAGITDHVHMHVVPRWTGDTNFMSSLGQTRVLPETLHDTYQRIYVEWERRRSDG